MITWKERSLRTIPASNTLALPEYRKFYNHKMMHDVELTGKTSKNDLIRCRTELYNNNIEDSHLYDVVRNQVCIVRSPYPYLHIYK